MKPKEELEKEFNKGFLIGELEERERIKKLIDECDFLHQTQKARLKSIIEGKE